MIDKELIGIWKNMMKPTISSLLLKTNYEGMGEQDKEEFERDFDEILDLALIGLKYKAQLSREGATSDMISRQAAIDELEHAAWGKEWDKALAKAMLESLPSAQPDVPDTNVGDIISRQAAIDALDCINGAEEVLRALPPIQPDTLLAQIAELVEGTIDHFDREDAMDLLYQIKDILA